MTETKPRCPRCTRPVEDGLLCAGCVEAFERAVADLGALLPELEVTTARLDEATRAIRHRPPVDPIEDRDRPVEERSSYALVSHAMPVNLDAAALASSVRVMVATWVAHLRRRHGDPAVRRWVAGRTVTAEAWLLASVEAVRRDDAARAIVTDLVSAARRVEEAVDRREPECYAGPCNAPDAKVVLEGGVVRVATDRICGVDLYYRFGEAAVKCPACGTKYVVAERRPFLLDAVREVWARPAVIATALAALDLDLTAARLDTWISRDKRRHGRCWPGAECGHIVPVALDSAELDEDGRPLGRPMYRVGDVLTRVETLRAERDARAKEEAL